jgi:heptosyltransferase-2
MRKICIIKLGALGDVLRTTPFLRCLKQKPCAITWVTEKDALRFITNELVDVPVVFKDRLVLGPFDVLYNFDEDKNACEIAERVKATVKKGYGWNGKTFYPFDKDAQYAYDLTHNDELKFKANTKNYQEIIFGTAGETFHGEEYVFEHKPSGAAVYDIGVNYLVGDKFPLKTWPHWRAFEQAFGSKAKISVQRIFQSMAEYISWIDKCDTVVTTDSLGMHIAIALKKKVIALLGNTSHTEINLYGRGVKLFTPLPCVPCYKKKCQFETVRCMDAITPEKVWNTYEELIRG